MIGDGESGDVSFFGKNNVTSAFSGDFPAKFFKCMNYFARSKDRNRRNLHINFNLSGLDSNR